MSLALYFAVSTGQWDAAENPSVDEKNPPSSTEKPEPKPTVLVHPWTAVHPANGSVRNAASATMGLRIKLMVVRVRPIESAVPNPRLAPPSPPLYKPRFVCAPGL